MQRRSARNTTRKKYTEDYDFKITDDESSSSSDNEGKESSKKSKKKASVSQPVKPVVKSVKVKQEVEENLEVDVESVEPSAAVQGTQFFVVSICCRLRPFQRKNYTIVKEFSVIQEKEITVEMGKERKFWKMTFLHKDKLL